MSVNEKRQVKVTIPTCEIELAKEQARNEGWGKNYTGYVRWLIRSKSGTEKSTTEGA